MWATAVMDFTAQNEREIQFKKNERLCVLYGPEDKNWWLLGNAQGRVGWAPTNSLADPDMVKDSDTALAVSVAVNKQTQGVITKRELDQILTVLGKAENGIEDELYECTFATESDEKLVFVSEFTRLVANNLDRHPLVTDLRILARYGIDRSLVLREVTKCNGDVDAAAKALFELRHELKDNLQSMRHHHLPTPTISSDDDEDSMPGSSPVDLRQNMRRLHNKASDSSLTEAFPPIKTLSYAETNIRIEDIMRFGYTLEQARDALDKANGDVEDALMLLVANS